MTAVFFFPLWHWDEASIFALSYVPMLFLRKALKCQVGLELAVSSPPTPSEHWSYRHAALCSDNCIPFYHFERYTLYHLVMDV